MNQRLAAHLVRVVQVVLHRVLLENLLDLRRDALGEQLKATGRDSREVLRDGLARVRLADLSDRVPVVPQGNQPAAALLALLGQDDRVEGVGQGVHVAPTAAAAGAGAGAGAAKGNLKHESTVASVRKGNAAPDAREK